MSNTDKLATLDAGKQMRLDTLLTKINAGQLTNLERNELQLLVREVEQMTLTNASLLVAVVSEERVYTPDEALKLEVEAQERAFARRSDLLQGALTASQAARLLGITQQMLHDRAQSRTWLLTDGCWDYQRSDPRTLPQRSTRRPRKAA